MGGIERMDRRSKKKRVRVSCSPGVGEEVKEVSQQRSLNLFTRTTPH